MVLSAHCLVFLNVSMHLNLPHRYRICGLMLQSAFSNPKRGSAAVCCMLSQDSVFAPAIRMMDRAYIFLKADVDADALHGTPVQCLRSRPVMQMWRHGISWLTCSMTLGMSTLISILPWSGCCSGRYPFITSPITCLLVRLQAVVTTHLTPHTSQCLIDTWDSAKTHYDSHSQT